MTDATRQGRGGPRLGSGRKPLPPGQKQSKRVMVTLTEAEHVEATKAAGEKPLGTFIRDLLLRYLARRKK